MADFYNIFASQMQYLQSEFATLIVKNTFDERTSRLFKSFENHSSAFSQQSPANIRVAAELSAATNFRRPNYRRAGLRPTTPLPPHRGRRGAHHTGRGHSTLLDDSPAVPHPSVLHRHRLRRA